MRTQYQSDLMTVTKRRPTIGVFKGSHAGHNHILQWQGILDASKKHDVNLFCYSGGQLHYPDGEETESAIIYKLVNAEQLDGIIIWSGNLIWDTPFEQFNKFIKSLAPIPVVCVEAEIEGVTCLTCEDFEGMSQVIAHLIEIHHYKRIAFIKGSKEHFGIEQRYQAYLHTLHKYGIPFDPDLVWDYHLFHQGERGIRILIKKITSAGIDAVASCCDHFARMLINLLHAQGVPLPPIVGFDDELENRASKPTLTTVQVPFYRIGWQAVEMLLNLIAGQTVMQPARLPCKMVVRQSCGCNTQMLNSEDVWESVFLGNVITFNSKEDLDYGGSGKKIDTPFNTFHMMHANWDQKLQKAFRKEVLENESNVFINYLEELLDGIGKNSENTDVWRDIVVVMHGYIKFFIKSNSADLIKAQKLLHQGMMLVAESAIRTQVRARLQESSRQYLVISFNQEISEVFDLDLLLKKMEYGLKQLGISGCYLSIYENAEKPIDRARLIMAYDQINHKTSGWENVVFPSNQLVPRGILADGKRFAYIIKPLFFQKRQIGFALFDAGFSDLTVYELISNGISVSLQGAMLVAKLENQAAELSKANTDLEAAYQSLQENQQKLLISEKMASLGRLTAGIAHEMNTPLAVVRTAIKELGDLIDEYKKSIENPLVLPEDHKAIAADMSKYLELAEQAAEKSAVFIRGIKGQTIDAKFVNLQLFNAALVISDALNVLKFAIKEGRCNLESSLDDSIWLYGEPRRLVQIVTNLVMNSIEACRIDGGIITVKLAGVEDSSAELTVTDTGLGIPEEHLFKIFDPMFTTKPFGEGTGLGLSIVHDLVKEFNGSIRVSSRKGLTSFRIMLPVSKEGTQNG